MIACPSCRRAAYHTALCIIMLLGHIAVELPSEYGARVTVINIFQQRLFHPVSNLDSFLVTELGRIAARTRVSYHAKVTGNI